MITKRPAAGTAYTASHQYFSKTTLPFGAGIVVSPDNAYATRSAVQRPYLRTKPQWYELTIPHPERFLDLDRPLTEQPFPLVHALMSNRSLSLLFAGERALVTRQTVSFDKTQTPEEPERSTSEEDGAFYHRKREELLVLPTVSAFCQFILERSGKKDPAVISAFLSRSGISGIRFYEDAEVRLLIFDPRKETVITAIHREPGEASGKTTKGANYE
jgi:hypothetical protein